MTEPEDNWVWCHEHGYYWREDGCVDCIFLSPETPEDELVLERDAELLGEEL